MMNHVEKATHMDLNRDGHVGGGATQHKQQSGGGLLNKLEKITNMDLNGDGRIGGGPRR